MPDEDIGLSVSIENIVMEGSRRLEEWNRIKKKIPSMDIVFKMATAPGEGTFEISLKPDRVEPAAPGRRHALGLASSRARLGRTDFEVARVIYGLFSAGLLEVASDEEVERLRAERHATRGARGRSCARPVRAAAAPKKREGGTCGPLPKPPLEPSRTCCRAAGRGGARGARLPRAAAGRGCVAEDMAVFEQMMGAVLQAPAAGTVGQPEAPVEPEPAQEPPRRTGARARADPRARAHEPSTSPSPSRSPSRRPEPEPGRRGGRGS